MSALEMCYDDAVPLAECHRALTLLMTWTARVIQYSLYRTIDREQREQQLHLLASMRYDNLEMVGAVLMHHNY